MALSPIERLYESDDYLVVNKPYDMYINSDDPEEKNTLVSQIADHDSHLKTSSNRLYFAHRLDYATSGVLCLARGKRAAAAAGRHFERRTARKYYLAVVRGHVPWEACDIAYDVGEDLLVRDGSNRMRAVASAEDARGCGGARAARTRLLLLETGHYGAEPASVVLLKPTTGRRHQLRVHCARAGHTLLGDYTYSDRRDSEPHRMFLHAIRLVMPFDKDPLDVETEEPYFTDAKFATQWQSERSLLGFRSGQERLRMYETIDSVSDVVCLDYNKC